MTKREKIDFNEGLIKLRTYCNYRDRCHKEVRQKLWEYNLSKADRERIISALIEEGLLNEERYARSFARGHFYMKQWGKAKIVAALRSNGLNDRLIDVALGEIDEGDYQLELQKLVEKKLAKIKGNVWEKRKKITSYLQQKGYSYNEYRHLLP
ncbi:MAG: hypothetical protein Kow0075_00420 [Salibacteraceae bacterium]